MPDSLALAFSQALLMLVFLGGAVPKLGAWEEFVGVVYNYRILPDATARPLAYLIPIAELGVGIALAVPALRVPAAAFAAFLLGLFSLAITVNLLRGRREIDCGCFSSVLKQNLSWWLVVRNLGLIALAVWFGSAAGAVQTIGWVQWLIGGAVAGMVVIFYMTGAVLSAAGAQRSARVQANQGVK